MSTNNCLLFHRLQKGNQRSYTRLTQCPIRQEERHKLQECDLDVEVCHSFCTLLQFLRSIEQILGPAGWGSKSLVWGPEHQFFTSLFQMQLSSVAILKWAKRKRDRAGDKRCAYSGQQAGSVRGRFSAGPLLFSFLPFCFCYILPYHNGSFLLCPSRTTSQNEQVSIGFGRRRPTRLS
jgi:hypothetical protein